MQRSDAVAEAREGLRREEAPPLKNRTWVEEGEKKVTAAQFRKRMKLESVSFYPDGSLEFCHDDGDLFWGHTILVSGTLRRGPTDADIPG